MFDDGLHGDSNAGDGIYGAILDPISGSANVEFYITASDATKTERQPYCGYRNMYINNSSVTLAINEVMPSNDMTLADEFGEFDDWVEIYNFGSTVVNLGDKYLSDNPDNHDKWGFPDISIQPGEFLLVWVDNDEEQGDLHADFKLSADGEYIGIFDSEDNNFSLIDGIGFQNMEADEAIGRFPDGIGSFTTVIPTPGNPNMKLVSAEEVAGDIGMKLILYPNPVGDMLFIKNESSDFYDSNIQIELYDLSGRLVKNFIIKDIGQSIDLNGLMPGIFTYRLQVGEKLQNGKLIKL